MQTLVSQQATFGNPRRILTDRGGAFRGQEFKEYCQDENIEHVELLQASFRNTKNIHKEMFEDGRQELRRKKQKLASIKLEV